jgi:hypothetical protein
MPRPRHVVWTAFLLSASSVAAQRPTADTLPAAGARVRVSAAPLPPVVGTVLAYRGDTLLVRRLTGGAEDTTRVRLGDVQRLEVSVGKRRRRRAGALLGLAGGGAAGAVVGAVTYADQPSRCTQNGSAVPCVVDLDFGRGFSAAAGGVLGAAAGLVIGLAVGARQVDRWAAVDVARRSSRLRVVPHGGRFGSGLAVVAGF